MAKTFVYEFVFGLPDGEQSRIYTVRSNNWRDAVKAIQRYNAKDEVIAFQLADPKTSGLRGAKVEKDVVVEHPTMPNIRSLASEPD
jgi:hypothetical protein